MKTVLLLKTTQTIYYPLGRTVETAKCNKVLYKYKISWRRSGLLFSSRDSVLMVKSCVNAKDSHI